MKLRYCWLLAAVLVWTGCGKEERREGTSLFNVLTQKHADMAAVNALEKDLVGSTRAWYEGIINNGAGKGKDLEQNAESAKSMAFSASEVANQLGHLRQGIYDLPLQQEYPQSVRSAVINQMMQRQKKLQEVRLALEASSAGFLDLARSTAYKGDSYPPEIDKVNSLTSGYVMPEDALAKAIGELKVKYTLEDVDLAGRT